MIPIRALIRWAPKTALGCAAGAEVITNRNKAVPPKDANISGEKTFVAHKARLIATEAPSKTHNKRKSKIFKRPGLLL